jgi:hypothetical protein
MDLSPDNLNEIISYLKEKHLYLLMTTCKFWRNFICASVNGREVFKTFLSIKLSIKDFVMRDYYGSCYCLHVVKKWIGESFNDHWSVYSLINNLSDVRKLCSLSGFVSEYEIASKYHGWTKILPEIAEEIAEMTEELSETDVNKILSMTYLNTENYINEYEYCTITIVNTKLVRGKRANFAWYPIKGPSKIDPNHFHCNIKFECNRNDRTKCWLRINMNKKGEEYIPSKKFSEYILDLSMKLNVKFDALYEIIIILLGRSNYNNQEIVRNFIDRGNSKCKEDPPDEYLSDENFSDNDNDDQKIVRHFIDGGSSKCKEDSSDEYLSDDNNQKIVRRFIDDGSSKYKEDPSDDDWDDWDDCDDNDNNDDNEYDLEKRYYWKND